MHHYFACFTINLSIQQAEWLSLENSTQGKRNNLLKQSWKQGILFQKKKNNNNKQKLIKTLKYNFPYPGTMSYSLPSTCLLSWAYRNFLTTCYKLLLYTYRHVITAIQNRKGLSVTKSHWSTACVGDCLRIIDMITPK